MAILVMLLHGANEPVNRALPQPKNPLRHEELLGILGDLKSMKQKSTSESFRRIFSNNIKEIIAMKEKSFSDVPAQFTSEDHGFLRSNPRSMDWE